MATESSDNAAPLDAKPKPDAGATKRAKLFRERHALTDVKRWEIYTTEAIKSEVRDIAKQEGLSAGVAAEALLRLGIETYLSRCETSVECELPERKLGPMTELFVMAQQQSTLPSTHPSIIGSPIKANQSNQDLTKPLVTYSSRTTQNIPEPTLIPKPLANAPDVATKGAWQKLLQAVHSRTWVYLIFLKRTVPKTDSGQSNIETACSSG